MKEVNYPLRKSYLTTLAGISYNGLNIPSFHMVAPDGTIGNYIVFGGVTNNDISTKSSADTGTLMRVTVRTQDNKYNSGIAADNIAGQVLSRIYPKSNSFLDMSADNFQMIATELVSDITQDYSIKDSVSFVDRILIFRHKIYHRE